MKKLLVHSVLFWLAFCFCAVAQVRVVDSLKQKLTEKNNDTTRFVLFDRLSHAFEVVNYDSALFYARNAIQVSQQLGYKLHLANSLLQAANVQMFSRSSASALETLHKAKSLLEEPANSFALLPSHYLYTLAIAPAFRTVSVYRFYLTGVLNTLLAWVNFLNYREEQTRFYALRAEKMARQIGANDLLSEYYMILGTTSRNPDSSLYFLKKGYQHDLQTGYRKNLGGFCDYMAKAYHEKKDTAMDLFYKRANLQYNLQEENLIFTGWAYLNMADYYKVTPLTDSTIFYCHKALQVAQNSNSPAMEYWSSVILKDTYKALGKTDSAFAYMERMVAAKDQFASEQEVRQFQAVEYNQQLQQKELDAAKAQFRSNMRTYLLGGGIIVVLLVAGLLWRNVRHKQKAYDLVQQQKRETEKAYEQLKATQAQLIQQEKMASLGELTAGIAHEIQNPLNFVTNFAETNAELLADLQEATSENRLQEAKTLANDIRANEEKIVHHSRRADAIVKAMLLHSRASSGRKEPVDINALAGEFLRLSYHGMRAKEKGFHATIETHFDESIGPVAVVKQDIGRVLLNLFNNAFYAVNEKRKQSGSSFLPTVTVNTHKEGDLVTVAVTDNGTGMTQKVVEKVFQPFFTTKPTGEGTGLGLSLSYDIVTKGHGGDIKVKTKEGEGAEFLIQLPLADKRMHTLL